MIAKFLSSLIAPVAGIFQAKEERKTIAEVARGKIAQSKLDSETNVQLTDAEWESLTAGGLGESWKDEYVTLVITSPLLLIMGGSIYQAFTGDDRLLVGINLALGSLTALNVDMGFLMSAVVMAAVGLKVWRGK